jgi:hypothetical protein
MGDLARPRSIKCARCGKRIPVAPIGRVPRYCSQGCRVMHHATKKRMTKLPPPMADDEKYRARMWRALVEFGLVEGEMPAPKPPKPPDDGEVP